MLEIPDLEFVRYGFRLAVFQHTALFPVQPKQEERFFSHFNTFSFDFGEEQFSMNCQCSPGTICAVKVDVNRDTVLDWYALKVNHEQTFASLFESVCEASHRGVPGARFKGKIDVKEGSYSSCFIKASDSTSEIEVGWTLLVNETLAKFNCSHVYFKVSDNFQKDKTTDAFSQLIEGQRKLQQNALKYPSLFGQGPVTRGDWMLKNDFIEKILKTKSIGFFNGEEKSVGRTIVNAICDCLYNIFPHLSTLKQRYIALHPMFDVLYDKKSLTQGYNDPSKYKHTVKPMERSNLVELSQNLFKVLTLPCMSLPRMSELKQSVLQLASDVSKYSEYLVDQNKRVLTLHNLPHPVRQPGDGVSTCLRHIPGCPRDGVVCDKYSKLEKALSDVDSYSPICINDFAPSDRQKRYHYIQDIKFPFDVTVYAYSTGGPYESLHFIWKCSKTLELQQSNKVIHDIEKQIPVYHTRAMRRDFRDRFSLVCKATASVMNEMYRHLTGDSSVPSSGIEKSVRERLIVLLDSQNPDLVYDMRTLHHNNANMNHFEKFFEEVEKYINEYELKAVDDRRHGLVSHLSVAMSVRDLKEQISTRLPNGTPIPSEEWLRLQFMPKNEAFHSAVRYTGRFPLKYKIQSRQFNAFHIDAHYVSALQMYLKEFVVQNRENCVLLSVDDKNHIPVGEPGFPIAAIYRSKKTVTHSNVLNIAADHDTASKCKLTPSVTLVIDIPEESSGDFYSGQVSVSLKDTIFEPSSPLRHVAEMRKVLGLTGNLGKPIRVVHSDGGPDHRVTYPSVKLGLIAMFLLDDCDYLLALRIAPHQSYRNWVERIMSILNLALQTVAICRSTMSPDMEHILKSLNTMAAIRKNAQGNDSFKDALMSSLDNIKQTLNDLFSRLTLKGKKFNIEGAASDALMDELWDAIQDLDSTVLKSDTQSKQLEKRPRLKEFMDHCTTSRKYFFLIKKCGSGTCHICKPPRLAYFESLHHFPDPQPSKEDANKYLTYAEVYGKPTTEEFCPSLKAMLNVSASDSSQPCRMTAETIRDFVKCTECSKPRGIYAASKLTKEEQEHLEVLKEEGIFSCGGTLVPRDHILHRLVFAQSNVTCAAPVVAHLYSARAKYPLFCYNCGTEDVQPVSNDLKQRFQSVHPVCEDCKLNNVKERTRGAKRKYINQ